MLGSPMRLISWGLTCALCALLSLPSAAQTSSSKPSSDRQATTQPGAADPQINPASGLPTSKVTLDASETLFSVLTAINACGYDHELGVSDPMRSRVRQEVNAHLQGSSAAAAVRDQMCRFYDDHQQDDPARTVAQYISLGLNLGPPPDLAPRVKEADMPPDAAYVLAFVPLLARFYRAADLHQIWSAYQPDYQALFERFHEPLASMLLNTEVYLKMPISGFLGRGFVVYLEPMAAPGQVNARNYGSDYFMVVSPGQGELKLDQIRHTYLHFILDPQALKRASAMKYLEPIVKDLKYAPLDDAYKNDVSLLVTESLIRAIEAHLIPGKPNEGIRQKSLDDSMAEGFVLTRYFYDALTKFQAEPTGLKDAYPGWLYDVDVPRERKRAASITFSNRRSQEVVSTTTAGKVQRDPLDVAEQKLGEGDVQGAQKLAQQVADQKRGNVGRAYLILGQAAALQKDGENAVHYFETSLQVASDPNVIAWAHIYLGRIYDVQEERDLAVKHYESALRAGDPKPATRAAAEKGLKQAYQPRQTSEAGPKTEEKNQ
ncbi:MAG TPA: tetratricopeptide repeat protein [Terriglobales bacterium]|nr:tetratricopeptide repeat protein [Terriglobales bacterium]